MSREKELNPQTTGTAMYNAPLGRTDAEEQRQAYLLVEGVEENISLSQHIINANKISRKEKKIIFGSTSRYVPNIPTGPINDRSSTIKKNSY